MSTPAPTEQAADVSTNGWFSLLQKNPNPFTTPLPQEAWTPIDGTYAKLDPSEPQWWACRRCADYRPVTVAFFGFSHEGGVDAEEK